MLLLGVVYRYPSHVADQIDQFSEYLRTTLHSINLKNVPTYRFNLDLMRLSTNNDIRQYVNTRISLFMQMLNQFICQNYCLKTNFYRSCVCYRFKKYSIKQHFKVGPYRPICCMLIIYKLAEY